MKCYCPKWIINIDAKILHKILDNGVKHYMGKDKCTITDTVYSRNSAMIPGKKIYYYKL